MTVERLLGRKIVGRAQHFLIMSHCQRSFVAARHFREPGQSEVEHFHNAVLVQQQVARLDVPVDQPILMSMIEPESGLPTELSGILKAEWPVLSDDFLKVLAFDVLHDQKMNFLILLHLHVDVVGADDVRVIERRHGLGLAMKSRQVRRVVDLLDWQNLDRTGTPHERVFGEVNGAHAAFAEQLSQPILAEPEALVLPLLQLVDLPVREVAVTDHPRTDRRRTGDVDTGFLHRPHQRLDSVMLDQVALLQHVQKRVSCKFCHSSCAVLRGCGSVRAAEDSRLSCSKHGPAVVIRVGFILFRPPR